MEYILWRFFPDICLLRTVSLLNTKQNTNLFIYKIRNNNNNRWEYFFTLTQKTFKAKI